jgi:hypothetical protein
VRSVVSKITCEVSAAAHSQRRRYNKNEKKISEEVAIMRIMTRIVVKTSSIQKI